MHPFTDPAHGLDLSEPETTIPATTEVVIPVASANALAEARDHAAGVLAALKADLAMAAGI